MIRLVDAIGERARGAREEEERRDEDRAGQHDERGGVQARLLGQPERHHDAHRALQQVVVEGAEELRDEQRCKPTGRQELDERRSHDKSPRQIVTAAQAAVTRRSLIEPMRGWQPAVGGKGDRLQHDPEDECRGDIRRLVGNLFRRDAALEHRAHGVDRVRGSRRELAQLPVLHEEQKPEERRVLIVRLTEAANHRRQLSVRRRLGLCEGVEPARELHVVAFEDGPHELVLADEMAIEGTLRDIDRPGDIPHAGFGHALFDEEADGGLLDAIARVGESMSWHCSCSQASRQPMGLCE